MRRLAKSGHAISDEHRDFATTAVLDGWIGRAEELFWFLFEASRTAPGTEVALRTGKARTASRKRRVCVFSAHA
jgi:hypothetical protein